MPSSSLENFDAFGFESNHRRTYHHRSSSRHHASVNDTPPHNEPPRTNGPYQESYMQPVGLTPTSSWQSTSLFDPHFTAVGGTVLPTGHRVDEPQHLASTFGASDCNTPRLETATSMLAQPFSIEERAFYTPQHYPPPPQRWIAPEPSWQPSSVWDHPVRSIDQYGGQSGSFGSLDMQASNPPSQVASSFLSTGYTGHGMIPTAYSATPPSVRPSTHAFPVATAAPTSQFYGEPSDLSLNVDTFQCLWTNGGTRCRAFIKGDRKSVTSHLRDMHAFTCDGMTIPCAWGQCTAPMQRRNIPRHIVACHLEIKYECPLCWTILSRPDAIRKHRSACSALKSAEMMEGGRKRDDWR